MLPLGQIVELAEDETFEIKGEIEDFLVGLKDSDSIMTTVAALLSKC